ncbi:MAG: protein-L-isoaspartate(D-aspartate) O-methyltransferase [Tepidisphaeraceae bacterium]
MAFVASTTDPRQRMVDEQIVARGIRDPRVIEAMTWLPRERFVPADVAAHAYDDAAIPIGHGQTISQPYIVALMSEALDVHADDTVLEIGTGCGYQAAVLSRLAKEVFTVERIKPLLDDAFERLASLHLRNIRLHFSDGSCGWPEKGPFDRIIMTAGAPDVSTELLDQLKVGGSLVAPVGPLDAQTLVKLTKHADGVERVKLCECRFVPLIGEGGWPA